MNLHGKGGWCFRPFADCPAIHTNKPPCRFWRWMQWIVFGFRWEKEKG